MKKIQGVTLKYIVANHNIPLVIKKKIFRETGKILGKIHSVKITGKYKYLQNALFKTKLTSEKWQQMFKSQLTQRVKYLFSRKTYLNFKKIFKSYINVAPKFSKLSILHGDYYLTNIIVSKSSFKIAAIIDFENLTFGPAEYELADLDIWLSKDKELRNSFFDGYKTTKILSSAYYDYRYIYQVANVLEKTYRLIS